jgi:hypothetical protein
MNSLAFADNPSDAPLVNDVQQDTTANATVNATRHQPKNKDVRSSKKMGQPAKSKGQETPHNMPVATEAGASPAS